MRQTELKLRAASVCDENCEAACYFVHLVVDQLVCEAWTRLLLLQTFTRVFFHSLIVLVNTRPEHKDNNVTTSQQAAPFSQTLK